jgi:hypothetical protein
LLYLQSTGRRSHNWCREMPRDIRAWRTRTAKKRIGHCGHS